MPNARYQLLDRIAKGGMAELYRARALGAEGFSKILAIKRILPNLADEKPFVEMLIDEARMVANLSHPNIVQVFELGHDPNGYFIVMEFINGPNLAAVLKRLNEAGRKLPEACTLDITIQLLQALDYAHRMTDASGQPMNLVHRDVSPENVLLGQSGAVKLSDFGVAKARNRLHMTQAGNIKGKVPYMSPEQLQGKDIDARTDIFAAGLVLWECLAGQRHYPIEKMDMAIMRNVAEGKIRPLSEVGVTVAPEVEKALMKALAPDMRDRYGSAWEFANDLMLYHRRAYPAHTPAAVGQVIQELFKPQLEALAERLRRFESGQEKPAGEIGLYPTGDTQPMPAPGPQPSTNFLPRLGDDADDGTARTSVTARFRPDANARATERLTTNPPEPVRATERLVTRGPEPLRATERMTTAPAPVSHDNSLDLTDPVRPAPTAALLERRRTREKLQLPNEPAPAADATAIRPTPVRRPTRASQAVAPAPENPDATLKNAPALGADDLAIDAALKKAKQEELSAVRAQQREKSSGVLTIIGAFAATGVVVAGLMVFMNQTREDPGKITGPSTAAEALAPATSKMEAIAPTKPGTVPSAHPPLGREPERVAVARPAKWVATPAEVGKTGLLDVDCKPDCELEIDGMHTGLSAPQKGIVLTAGTHTVKAVNRQLGLNKTVKVEISADRTETKPINLVQ